MTQAATTQVGKAFLHDIVSLQDLRESGVQLPETAMREVDEKYVTHLANTNYTEWPPVTLYDVPDHGLIMTDGYHRCAARRQQAALDYIERMVNAGIREQKGKAQEEAIKGLPQEALDAINSETDIKVEIRPFVDHYGLIKDALLANTKHGKGLKSPVNQALDYYLIAKEEEQATGRPAPSQNQVAILFGITRASLNEYIGRHNKALEKAAKDESKDAAPSDEPDQSEDVKKALRMIKGLTALIEKDAEAMTEPLMSLLPVMITGLCSAFSVAEQADVKAAIRQAVNLSDRTLLADTEQVHLWLLAAIQPDPVPSRQEKGKAKKAALKKALSETPDQFRQADIVEQIEAASSTETPTEA